MRKAMILLLAAVLAADIIACRKNEGSYAALGKYAEAGAVLDKEIAASETLAAALDKATSAEQVAAAFEAGAVALTKLAPKMNEVVANFPELRSPDRFPTELKPFQDRVLVVTDKLINAMTKAGSLLLEPNVVAAREKYSKAVKLIFSF
jgi:hypothetical protein